MAKGLMGKCGSEDGRSVRGNKKVVGSVDPGASEVGRRIRGG